MGHAGHCPIIMNPDFPDVGYFTTPGSVLPNHDNEWDQYRTMNFGHCG